MPTITALANGTSWATGASWVGGSSPADGDTAVIGANCTGMVFDANLSAYSTGITLICNGTLTAATSGNPYLKLGGSVTGTGNITVGSSGTRYPGNSTMTINLNGANSLNGPKLNLWCQAPTVPYARLVNSTPKAISGITLGNVTTINIPSHGYSVGDVLYFYGIVGTTELNGRKMKVKSVPDSGNITISWKDPNTNVDSSELGWTAYVSGGYAAKDNAAAASDTTLYLDRDVTSDPMWAANATVTIDNINRTNQSETRTIASVSAGNITISSGLTAAKLCGSYVHLVQRNVRIIGGTGSGNIVGSSTISGSNIDCEITGASGMACVGNTANITMSCGSIYGTSVGINGGSNANITGGTISGVTSAIQSGSGHNITGGVISGDTYAFNGGSGHTVNGSLIVGCGNAFFLSGNMSIGNATTIAHCQYATNTVSGSIISALVRDTTNAINGAQCVVRNAVIQGCPTPITGANGIYIINTKIHGHTTGANTATITFAGNNTFSQGTTDLGNYVCADGYGVTLNSATQVAWANSSSSRQQIALRDVGGVVGSIRAWNSGGTVIDDDGSHGLTLPNKRWIKPTSATVRVLWDEWLWAKSGEVLAVPVELKKDGTSWSTAPLVQLIDPANDPLDGGTALATWTPADNTNLQSSTITWTATKDVNIILRVIAANASGNLYFGFNAKQDQAPVGNVTSTTSYANGQLTGTLNMGNYTLISTVVNASRVLFGCATYSGGPTGTIALANVTVASGGTLADVVIAANGTVLGSEASRNTDPGVTNVANGTGYKIQNVSKTGNLTVGGNTTVASGFMLSRFNSGI